MCAGQTAMACGHPGGWRSPLGEIPVSEALRSGGPRRLSAVCHAKPVTGVPQGLRSTGSERGPSGSQRRGSCFERANCGETGR
jgi:hypothetical protein